MNCIMFIKINTRKKKNGLTIKDKKQFDYKKLRLHYECESEEEEKKRSDKKLDKKEPPKKQTKFGANEFNKLINKEEIDINS